MRKKLTEINSGDVGSWIVLLDDDGSEIARGLLKDYEVAIRTEFYEAIGVSAEKEIFSAMVGDKIYKITTIISMRP